MKNFTILFLTICCLFGCSVNNETKNSLTEANLKGNVSFVEKTEYEAVYKFGEIQNGRLKRKNTYKYDDKGNEIEKNFYNSSGSLGNKSTYKYDDKGNLIEENSYYSDGSLESKETYMYEFDKMGNWIKRVSFKEDKPDVITERVIEYY
jgi:hypothetical protein